MKTGHVSGRRLVAVGGTVFWHVAATVVGFALMVLGLAMGVSVVMLPMGLVVGLAGALLFVWGALGWKSSAASGNAHRG